MYTMKIIVPEDAYDVITMLHSIRLSLRQGAYSVDKTELSEIERELCMIGDELY